MFVFAFEGALFAFIVNGDRFVLFALLPRRKPRTSRQCSRLIILVKELNLTSDGYSDLLAPFGRWHGFRVYCGSDTSAIHKPQQKPAGVYREKISVSSRLTAALVLRRGAALSGRAFSSSRYRAPLFSVSIPLYDNRCRSRRTRTRTRAQRPRPTTTGTGTSSTRSNRDGSHAPASSHYQPHRQ